MTRPAPPTTRPGSTPPGVSDPRGRPVPPAHIFFRESNRENVVGRNDAPAADRGGGEGPPPGRRTLQGDSPDTLRPEGGGAGARPEVSRSAKKGGRRFRQNTSVLPRAGAVFAGQSGAGGPGGGWGRRGATPRGPSVERRVGADAGAHCEMWCSKDCYDFERERAKLSVPVHAKTDAALVDRDAVLSKVYRNYYQGTKYDLSAGKAAGPFGTPVRYKPGPGEKAVAGACGSDGAPCESWERSIASFRSVNIHLTNLGDHVAPVSWFLPASSLGGVFVPVPVRDAKVPEALSDALNTKVDRTKAFWVFRELAQFAYPRWNLVKDKIAALQKDLEADGARALDANDHAAAVVQAWRGLHDDLLVQFSDGWNYDGVSANVVGYPADWLERVDFGSASETTHACKTTCP